MEVPVSGYFLHATSVPANADNDFVNQLRLWLYTDKGISKFLLPISDQDSAIKATIPFIPYSVSKDRKDVLFAHRTSASKDKLNPLVPICFKAKKGDDRKIWAALDVPNIPDELRADLDDARKKLHVSVFQNRKEMPAAATLFVLTFEVRFRSQGNPTLGSYQYPCIAAVCDHAQIPIISPASLSFVLPETTLQLLKETHNIRLVIPGVPNSVLPVISAKQLMMHGLLDATPKDLIRFCLEYHTNLIKNVEEGGPRQSLLALDTLKKHVGRLQSLHTHSEGNVLIHPYHFDGFTKTNAVLMASKFNSLTSPISTFLFSPINPLSTTPELAHELNPLLYHERLTLHVHYYLEPTILCGIDATLGTFMADGPSTLFALTETRRPLSSHIPSLFPEHSTIVTAPEGPAPFYESDQEGRLRRGCYDGFIGLTRAAWAKHPIDKAIRSVGVRMGPGNLLNGSIYQTMYVATSRPNPNLSTFLQSGRRFGLFSMTKTEFTTPLADNPLLCLLRLGAMEGQSGTGRTIKFLLQLGSLDVPLITGLAPLSPSVLKLALNPLWPKPSEAFNLLMQSLTYFNTHRAEKGLTRSFMSLHQGADEHFLNRKPNRAAQPRGHQNKRNGHLDDASARPPGPECFYYIFANLPFVQDEMLFRLLKSHFPELCEPTWYHSTDPRALCTYLVTQHPTALPNIKAGFLEVVEYKLRLDIRLATDLPPGWIKDEPLSQISADALLSEAHMGPSDDGGDGESDKEDLPDEWDMPLQWINSRILLPDQNSSMEHSPPASPPIQVSEGPAIINDLGNSIGNDPFEDSQLSPNSSSPNKRRLGDDEGPGVDQASQRAAPPIRTRPSVVSALATEAPASTTSATHLQQPQPAAQLALAQPTAWADQPVANVPPRASTHPASPTLVGPQPAGTAPQATSNRTEFLPFYDRSHATSPFFSSTPPPYSRKKNDASKRNLPRPEQPVSQDARLLTPDSRPEVTRVLGATTQQSIIPIPLEDGFNEVTMDSDEDFVPHTQPGQLAEYPPLSDTNPPTASRRSGRQRRATTRFSPADFAPVLPVSYSEALIGTPAQRHRQHQEIMLQAEQQHREALNQTFARTMALKYQAPTKRDRLHEPSPDHEEWSGSSATIDSSRNTPPPNFGREGYDRIGLSLYGRVNNIVMEAVASRKITDRLLEGGHDYVVGLLRNSERLFHELNAIADVLAEEAADRELIIQEFHTNHSNPGPQLAQPSVDSYFTRLPATPGAGLQV